jgi:hypothetical protein
VVAVCTAEEPWRMKRGVVLEREVSDRSEE